MKSPPLEQHQIHLKDGTDVNYYVAGRKEGPPVVLLHGGGTDHALLSWADTLPALLAHGYRVYLPDAPGYGSSPLPAWPVGLSRLNDIVTLWAEAVGLQQAVYVGVSMGGAMALAYALNHPQRVKKLVLIGSYGLQARAPMHHLSYLMVRTPGFDRLNTWLARSPRLLKRTLTAIIRHPESLTDDLVTQVAQAMTNKDSQKAWNQFQRQELRWAGITTNYTPRLKDLRVPTLLIHGTHDTGVPLHDARKAAHLIPDAELRVVRNAGHWTQRDCPGEVNYALLRFLGNS